jgi:S1-C subfamily serine protease
VARAIARAHGLAADTGVLVLSVEPKGPAAEAGVLEGDVIVAFGERPITGIDDLMRALADGPIDVATGLRLVRRVERHDLNVTPRDSRRRAQG